MGGGGDTTIDPTAREEAAAKIAQEQWERYQQVFVPYENQQILKTTGYNPETGKWEGEGLNAQEYYDQLAGQANTAVQSSFTDALTADLNAAARAGLNPNSGGFDRIIDQNQIGRAESQGKNVSAAQQIAQDRYLGGLSNVAAIGAGESARALQGVGQAAQMATGNAISDAQTNAYNNAAWGQALATVGGAAASYHDWGKPQSPTNGGTR